MTPRTAPILGFLLVLALGVWIGTVPWTLALLAFGVGWLLGAVSPSAAGRPRSPLGPTSTARLPVMAVGSFLAWHLIDVGPVGALLVGLIVAAAVDPMVGLMRATVRRCDRVVRRPLERVGRCGRARAHRMARRVGLSTVAIARGDSVLVLTAAASPLIAIVTPDVALASWSVLFAWWLIGRRLLRLALPRPATP